MKSKIYTSDYIKNTKRTWRENPTYFFVHIYFDRGKSSYNPTPFPAMFTHNQIKEAMERAQRNPEDIPKPKLSIFKRLVRSLKFW